MAQIIDEISLMCLHPELRKFDLFGAQLTGNDYTAIDFMLVPCASRFVMFDGSEIGGEDFCVWDKDIV